MDGELLNTVTEQVIRMLRQRGITVTAGPQRPAGAAPAGPRAAAPRQESPRPAMTGKVFITAEALAQRITAGGGGAVTLAPNEFLTPGAVDLAEQKRVTIRRSPAVLPAMTDAASAAAGAVARQSEVTSAAQAAPACACSSIGVVTAAANETARSVLAGLVREGVAMVDMTKGDCWTADLARLCQAVASGQVAAGAAILPYAADAMVLANKTKGIRAVQGTRPESVAAAMRHFGANLLILEHAFSTYHQMRTMLRAFAAGAGAPPGGPLAAAISELEGR